MSITHPETLSGHPWHSGHRFVDLRVHRPTELMEFGLEKERLALFAATQATKKSPDLSQLEPRKWHGPHLQATTTGTVIGAVTPLTATQHGDAADSLSQAFDVCLFELHRIMTAYANISANPRFRPIVRQRCRKYVPCAFVGTNGLWTDLRFFISNDGLSAFPILTEEMDLDVLSDIAILVDRNDYSDPFLLAVGRARAANRAAQVEGDFPSAIVLAYTACEVLLNSVLLMTSWESGIPREETKKWFDGQQGLMSRITKHLPPRLGGNWNSQKMDDPIAKLRRLATVRHDVVHLGYTPSEAEALEGLDTFTTLDDFVRLRLSAKRKSFPRTALLLMGIPGMQRHGVSQQRIDELMSQFSDTEPTWLASYRLWLASS